MLFEFETNIMENPKSDIDDLSERFSKGNMFEELYDGYKNYCPKEIKANNEREALLLKIMMLDFAMNDLNLYLAINPKDSKVYDLFVKYSSAYQKYTEEYERKYQVLELCHDTYGKYTWGSNPWPWEGNNV